jgi:hypothetical protein
MILSSNIIFVSIIGVIAIRTITKSMKFNLPVTSTLLYAKTG